MKGTVVFVRDITDKVSSERERNANEERLRLATEAAEVGLWDFCPQSGELIWDQTSHRLFGVSADETISTDLFLGCVHPEDKERITAGLDTLFASATELRFDAEYRILRRNDGVERWIRSHGKVMRDEDGKATRFLGANVDITDRKIAEQRMRELSQRDALTGLPNRSLLLEYCSHLLALAHRTDNHAAILFVDLDRFKPINDSHGHHIGDQALRQVAHRLQACTRDEDIVGRLGGDEFLVALRYADTSAAPATVARNIIDMLHQPYQVGALEVQLSASIGISLYPQHATALDELIRHADTAMYTAKKCGRSNYKFYAPDVCNAADDRLSIESRIEAALENDELVLHYQPVIDVESGRIVAAEALLRLPTARESFLAPAQFLPIAEAAGLINRLGDWVIREACRQHQRWCQCGLPQISMSINVAQQQLRQEAFVTQLANHLKESGMNPNFLQIELKEKTVLQDGEDAIVALQKIRALGISVAIDDFGIGHSSMGMLNWLPLDQLKIDQSLVRHIGNDSKCQMMADTILALGKSLNISVVGEGIESEAAYDYLRRRGCDQAQGYYFCHPLAADAFEGWCRNDYPAAATR